MHMIKSPNAYDTFSIHHRKSEPKKKITETNNGKPYAFSDPDDRQNEDAAFLKLSFLVKRASATRSLPVVLLFFHYFHLSQIIFPVFPPLIPDQGKKSALLSISRLLHSKVEKDKATNEHHCLSEETQMKQWATHQGKERRSMRPEHGCHRETYLYTGSPILDRSRSRCEFIKGNEDYYLDRPRGPRPSAFVSHIIAPRAKKFASLHNARHGRHGIYLMETGFSFLF